MNVRISTKGKRPLRSLTPSDKINAIQRIHDGESKASVARDIGVPESTLRGWCKNEDKLRFMSRQTSAEKMTTDILVDKIDCSNGLLAPLEKRQRLDASVPLNFSSKIKFEEIGLKRSSLSGLEYSTNKSLADINFNSVSPEYTSYNASTKNKLLSGDLSRSTDASTNVINPLSSLTHLSGLTGMTQSPVAISFNELTSNLNFLAQLNPGLATISSFNNLAPSTNNLRHVKPRSQNQIHSPCSDNAERHQGLAVKNWAKQKLSSSNACDDSFRLNLDSEVNVKCSIPSLTSSTTNTNQAMPNLPDDPLIYWLKSQQTILGLNGFYQQPILSTGSPPLRSSTPQQNHIANTPPALSAPLTPSSTPSGSLDDKNTAWFNWCRAFGASLHNLAPTSIVESTQLTTGFQQPANTTTIEGSNMSNIIKPSFENILYSHLTKGIGSPSSESLSSNENRNDLSNADSTKPEDLSAKLVKEIKSSCLISVPQQSPRTSTSTQSPTHSPIIRSDADTYSSEVHIIETTSECRDVLENILYKINNNPNCSMISAADLNSIDVGGSDSDASYSGNNHHNNVFRSNNNNSDKTDEEEKSKFSHDNDSTAIRHGEKFLQWLENCSNPRVTAMQLMQLRFLIAAIKSGSETKPNTNNFSPINTNESNTTNNDMGDENDKVKIRRRK